jgi:hypothetical protein
MFDAGLIGNKYKAVEKVASKIDWDELSSEYRVDLGLKKVLKKLRPYVSDHGKSGNVASLTRWGVDYVRGLSEVERGRLARKRSTQTTRCGRQGHQTSTTT